MYSKRKLMVVDSYGLISNLMKTAKDKGYLYFLHNDAVYMYKNGEWTPSLLTMKDFDIVMEEITEPESTYGKTKTVIKVKDKYGKEKKEITTWIAKKAANIAAAADSVIDLGAGDTVEITIGPNDKE